MCFDLGVRSGLSASGFLGAAGAAPSVGSAARSFGVDLFRLFDHGSSRGRDDDGLRVVFVPALLLGDARIGSHGVAEDDVEINRFDGPSGQLGRRLGILLPEEAHGI